MQWCKTEQRRKKSVKKKIGIKIEFELCYLTFYIYKEIHIVYIYKYIHNRVLQANIQNLYFFFLIFATK